MGCCGGTTISGRMRTIDLRDNGKQLSSGAIFVRPAAIMVTITNELIFHYSRVAAIARIFTVLLQVRELERRIQTERSGCHGCKKGKKRQPISHQALDDFRRVLGTCSEEVSNSFKLAAGISTYTVTYKDLTGNPNTVTR